MLFMSPFALLVLLLSGISTGLGAPFVVNLIGGQLPLVIGMIIVTSVAVPFVLPSIVYAFVRSQFEIPLLHMMFLLSIALFTPLAAGWLTKKYFPAGSKSADKNSFHLSLIFIILINWGMFAKFAEFFYSEQTFLLQTVATAFLCYAAYCLVVYAGSTGSPRRKGQVSSPRAMSTMCLLPCLHSSSLAHKLQRLLRSTTFLTILEL